MNFSRDPKIIEQEERELDYYIKGLKHGFTIGLLAAGIISLLVIIF